MKVEAVYIAEAETLLSFLETVDKELKAKNLKVIELVEMFLNSNVVELIVLHKVQHQFRWRAIVEGDLSNEVIVERGIMVLPETPVWIFSQLKSERVAKRLELAGEEQS